MLEFCIASPLLCHRESFRRVYDESRGRSERAKQMCPSLMIPSRRAACPRLRHQCGIDFEYDRFIRGLMSPPRSSIFFGLRFSH